MSVIVKDEQGKIILMCKGADSVIEERLSANSKNSSVFTETKKCVDLCAEEGLRTLFLAEKVVDPNEFEQWYKKAEQAKLAIDGREEKVAEVDELIEVSMELIGSTAIEDRLQDEVADTI
jgi:phospholipid-translocating ATPase